jgi:hypothetical protein
MANHVLLNRGLGHVDTHFSELAHCPVRAPERIDPRHVADEVPDLLGYRWTARTSFLTQFLPMLPEYFPPPGKDRPGLYDQQGFLPVGPDPGDPGPGNTIRGHALWPLHGSLQNGQLVTQNDDICICMDVRDLSMQETKRIRTSSLGFIAGVEPSRAILVDENHPVETVRNFQ